MYENVARLGGGAIASIGENSALTINRSTLSNNTASNAPISVAGIGGAILNTGTLTVNNSTLSGNYARNDGGAINNQGSQSVVVINHSTIVGNDSGDLVGGIYTTGPGTTINNSIVAGNTAVTGSDLRVGVGANITFEGVNFIGDTTNISNFRPGTDLTFADGQTLTDLFDPILANNSGPTRTHALRDDSPAVDAGDNSTVSAGLTTDQRGFPRVIGASVDIGAFELLPALETVANSANYSAGLTSKISIADLLASLTGGGGALTLVSLGETGVTASSARISGDFIVYTPGPGQTGPDQISYQVTDGFQTITGLIQIVQNENGTEGAFNIVSIDIDIDGGVATVVAAGIPGFTYHLESSENLSEWTPRGAAIVCPGNGIMNFPDPGPLPARRYYRIVEPRQ